jgi:hypothetical protein
MGRVWLSDSDGEWVSSLSSSYYRNFILASIATCLLVQYFFRCCSIGFIMPVYGVNQQILMLRASLIAVAATSSVFVHLDLPSYADMAIDAHASKNVSDAVVAGKRSALTKAAVDGGYGPQAPRDISKPFGTNKIVFGAAPLRSQMNLCNIHIHEAAEHRGGQFTAYAGNGDGNGRGTGYKYTGYLSPAELRPLTENVGLTTHGDLLPGNTVEIHFVYSTAHVKPGSTLASCLSKENGNPQLRVEAVVAVLVNDRLAADFTKMTSLSKVNGYNASPNIPDNLGEPVTYGGSTTGPSYNLKPSPLQVTWNVRPKVVKVDILSVAQWFKSNPFNEDHAHGVRNLVIDPALLSPVQVSK